MSIKLMSDILQHVDLPTNEKFVLLKLSDHADHDGRNAYPSLGRVAHECRLSKRTVQKIVAKLVKQEVLKIERNEQGGRGRPRVYTINVATARELHPLAPYGSEKGEIASPFSGEKGESHDGKGESQDTKGCNSSSPEPSLTVQENRQSEGATAIGQGALYAATTDPSDACEEFEPSAARRKRAVQLPPSWQPKTQTICWARSEGFDDEAIKRELAKFADHALAKGSTYRDWEAAFRTWLRRAQDYNAERDRAVQGNGRRGDSILDVGARVAARSANRTSDR